MPGPHSTLWRVLVLSLALLNGAYAAWSQGWLLRWGAGPTQQTEPQRLARQIRPEALHLLTAQELRQTAAPPPSAANSRP